MKAKYCAYLLRIFLSKIDSDCVTLVLYCFSIYFSNSRICYNPFLRTKQATLYVSPTCQSCDKANEI